MDSLNNQLYFSLKHGVHTAPLQNTQQNKAELIEYECVRSIRWTFMYYLTFALFSIIMGVFKAVFFW